MQKQKRSIKRKAEIRKNKKKRKNEKKEPWILEMNKCHNF